jgi:outer membrane protein
MRFPLLYVLPVLTVLPGLTPAAEMPAAADSKPAVGALTLTTALELALAKNFTIQAAHFDPQIARAGQLQASGAFDPVFSANFYTSDGVGTTSADPLSNRPPAFYNVKVDSFEASLGGQLPFGLNYAFVANSQNQRGSFNNYADSFFSFGGIRLSQPLLRGLGFGPNLAGVRVARANRAIAEASFRQAVIDTITRTINVYSNLYFAQRAHQNAVRSRELADALLRENRRRLEVGSMSSADVTMADARVARLDDGVLQAERAMRDAQNLLRTLISSETRPEVDTPLAITPPAVRPLPTLDKVADLNRAFDARPDYRQALQNVKRAELNVANTRSQALPQVDLVGSYGYNGAGSNFSQSYRDLRTKNTDSWSAGAVVNLPLPLREGRGRFRAAKLTLAQAKVNLQRLEQSIVVEVANAAGQIENTAQRVEATRRARELAQQSLVAEEKRLQVGQSTTFTVLQFQDLLTAAQLSEDRAIADYSIALADYDRAIGTTLDVHGIKLDEPNGR